MHQSALVYRASQFLSAVAPDVRWMRSIRRAIIAASARKIPLIEAQEDAPARMSDN